MLVTRHEQRNSSQLWVFQPLCPDTFLVNLNIILINTAYARSLFSSGFRLQQYIILFNPCNVPDASG